MYFHQGGHGGAPPLEMMNRWFTRYLYGVQNGVEKDPRAWIVRETAPARGAADGRPSPATPPPAGGQGRGRAPTPPPTPYADYPNPGASPVTLHLQSGGGARGGLRLDAAGKQGTETLVDNVEFSGAALAKAEQSPNRLLYATPELTAPVHISGTASITVAARVEQAGREPLGVARGAAVDRRPDQSRRT